MERKQVSKECSSAHWLERAEGSASQDMKRKQVSKGYSLAGEVRGQDWSEEGMTVSQEGKLTCWREERLGLVRTWEENEPTRVTHSLKRSGVRAS